MFTLQYWTKALQQRTKQNYETYNEAMQKFVGVLDKYARVCNLSLFRSRKKTLNKINEISTS